MDANQLILFSIAATARVLGLGKDAVYKLVADGRIGFIEVGKRKKIPYQELVRFQKESLKRSNEIDRSSHSMAQLVQTILSPLKSQPNDLDINSFINKKLEETKWQS
jgi:excisionase family DNA binding protein